MTILPVGVMLKIKKDFRNAQGVIKTPDIPKGDNMNIRYSYKGTEFLLWENKPQGESPFFEVRGLISFSEEIVVPSTVNSYEVRSLSFSQERSDSKDSEYKHSYFGVRRLTLPSAIRIHSLYNINFPDLEELCFTDGTGAYSFADGMLYDNEGKRLVLTFNRGMQSGELRIPSVVRRIGSNAFRESSVPKITFSYPGIEVEGNPFEGSEWYENHRQAGENIIIGDMFFRYLSSEELTLDPTIKRINTDCFRYGCPDHLITHFIPSDQIINALDRGGCRKLTITSDCAIPWDSLRKWNCLKEIRLPAHSVYCDKEGIVFDKERDELIFYPAGRTDEEYTIPEDTVSIGCKSFMGQKHLIRVTLCSNVSRIRPGAFSNCSSLKYISLENSIIKELPDSGIFQESGVFEGCTSLKEIVFPKTLRRIGNRSFRNTGLQGELVLNEGIESIGMYAFSDTALTQISLSKTIKHISPGAFCMRGSTDHLTVSVYEGSTYGLFEALEYVPFGLAPSYAQVIWQSVDIRFLDQKGTVKEIMHIPQHLTRGFEKILEIAITECKLDRKLYLECFDGISNKKEKTEFALKILKENGDTDCKCEVFVKQSSPEIAEGFITDGKEEELINFLKGGYMEPDEMRSVLKTCNEKEMGQASAYILHFLSKNRSDMTVGLSL